MRLTHHGASKPLLPDFNLLSLGEVSRLDPYRPPLGALLAEIHWLLLSMHAPATITLPARQRGWFPIGSGKSSHPGHRPPRGLLLSRPQNSPSPLLPTAARPSPGHCLLSQALPSQHSHGGSLAGSSCLLAHLALHLMLLQKTADTQLHLA